MKVFKKTLFVVFLLTSAYVSSVFADNSGEEHSLILLLGPAMEKSTSDGSKAYGTYLGLEFTAIEHQLEIEVGTQYLSTSNPKELGGFVIFKKPFELAKDVELGLGMGPAVWRKTSSANNGLQTGITFVADFMFWTTKEVGWYISPGYTYGFTGGGERSVGISAGLLFSM